MTKWKKMGKRGLSLFLALIMCLGMLNLTAFAAESDEAADIVISEGLDTSAEVQDPEDTQPPKDGEPQPSEDETAQDPDEDAQTPDEGGDDAQAPDEDGDDDVQSPDEGEDDTQTPDEDDDVQSPDEGDDDVQSPDEGDNDVQSPDEDNDDVQSPDEGDDDIQSPDEDDAQSPEEPAEVEVPIEDPQPSALDAFLDAIGVIWTLNENDAEADELLAALDAAWEAYYALSDEEKANSEAAQCFEMLEALKQIMTLAAAGMESKRVGKGAAWGHPAATFDSYANSSWSKSADTGSNASYFMFTNDNKVVYCIEPGVGLSYADSDKFNSTDETANLWGTISGSNPTRETRMKTVLGLILQYGYQGDFGSTWGDTNPDPNEYNQLAQAMATQLLVWEVVTKQRNLQTFEYVGPGNGYDSVKSLVGTGHAMYNGLFRDGAGPCPADFDGRVTIGDGVKRWGWYEKIAYQVQKAIATANAISAIGSITLNQSNNWTVTKTIDGLADNPINYSNNYVKVTSSGNTLTITASKKDAEKTGTITLSNKLTRPEVLVWNDGSYGPNISGNRQDTITIGTTTVPVKTLSLSYTIEPETVNVTVTKGWSANTPVNIKNAMTVTVDLYQGNNKVQTATLNSSNSWSQTFSNLPAGSYSVKETGITFTAGSGYTVKAENGGWTVYSGSTAVGAFKPTVSGTTVTNTWNAATDAGTGSLTFSKVGNTPYGPQNVPLSGAEFTLTNGSATKTATSSNGSVTFNFSLADVGDWTLTETKAPDGYNANATKWTVTVTKGAFTGNVTYSGNTPVNNYSVTATIDGMTNNTVVNNHKVANLTVTKSVTYNGQQSQAPNTEDEFVITVQVGNSEEPQIADIRWDGKDSKGWPFYIGDGLYTFIVQAGTSATLEDIPTGISYKVVEEKMPEGYTHKENDGEQGTLTQNTNITVNNRYFESQTDEIEGYKDWGDVPEELRPDFITVQLWRTSNKDGNEQVFFAEGQTDEDGNVYVYATAPGSSQWGYSFGELPLYAAEDDPYTYSVKETGISYGEDAAARLAKYLDNTPGKAKEFSRVEEEDGMFIIYGTAIADNGQQEVLGAWVPTTKTVDGKLVIENRWLGAGDIGEVDFQVKKVDAEDNNKVLSDAGFTLYDSTGENIVRDEVFTNENGIATFSKLSGGVYTLVETTAPEGHLLNTTVWTVTVGKTALESVEGTYTADGSLNGWTNNWLWESIAGQLTRNLTQFNFTKDKDGVGTLTVSDARIKGHIGITKVVDLDGMDVKDLDLSHEFAIYAGKIEDIEGDLPQLNPVDTMTVSGDGQITQEKWLDYGWYTIVETTPGTPDNYTWKNVEFTGGNKGKQGTLVWSTDEDDSEIEVTVYEVMIEEDGETVAVTAENFYDRELDPLSVTKTVNGNRGETDREWHFEITLTAPESYVSLENQVWYLPYKTVTTSLPNADGTVPAGVEGELKLMKPIDLAAQKAADEARAAFEAERPEPAEGEEPAVFDEAAFIAAFKADADNQALYPDTVNGKEIRVAAVTLKHGQTITIYDLPVGVGYEVVEVEANTDGYSTTITGASGQVETSAEAETDEEGNVITPAFSSAVSFVNYRNYTAPATVNVTVNKVWSGDTAEDRPERITVALYNGDELVETVTLTAANSWSHTWSRLNGKGDWRVEEVDVPDGYTSSVTQNGNSFTITNTYEEEEEPEEPTDIEDPDVPLSDRPNDEPNTDVELPEELEIPEEDVPLANIPDEDVPLVDIPEEDIPLSSVPSTGDSTGLWGALTLLSAIGMLGLSLFSRKKEK